VLRDQFYCERKDVQHSRLTRGKLRDPSRGPQNLSFSEPWTVAGYTKRMETSSSSGTSSAWANHEVPRISLESDN
jgi:hypothetical protein